MSDAVQPQTRLPWQHVLLAFCIIVIWGSNFVVIKGVLEQFPPLLFAALRFTFAVLPAIFFLRKPDVPWRALAAYGGFIGVGQFGVLYMAMNGQISPGLASVMMQSQVFFTILLSIWLVQERVRAVQWVALAIGAVGIGVIGWHTDRDITMLGLIMTLFAALNWAAGNLVIARSGRGNMVAAEMVAYVVWSSLFAVPPLFILSFTVEGVPAMVAAVQTADVYGWAGVLWQSFGNSLFGYAGWGWLMARHPAATIAPLALLIPVVGLGSAVWWLSEPLPAWKVLATALIVGGVALNMLWPRFAARRNGV